MNASQTPLEGRQRHETALDGITRRLVDTAQTLNHEDRMFCGLAMLDIERARIALRDDDPRSAQHQLHRAADRLDWIATERDRNSERRKRLPDPAQLEQLEQLAHDVDAVRRGL